VLSNNNFSTRCFVQVLLPAFCKSSDKSIFSKVFRYFERSINTIIIRKQYRIIVIEKGLENHETFAMISRKIGKDPSTVSKEVRRHISYYTKKDSGRDIPCANRTDCCMHMICLDDGCARLCKYCQKPNFHCTKICPHYLAAECDRLKKPPYVCNGCSKKGSCFLRKSYYSAKYAQDLYTELLISS